MWSYEHSLETTAAPERIWQTCPDVPGWACWNPDIEQVSIEGAFAVGSEIAMDAVRLRLTDVRVTYRTEISGPDGAELGPMITADFPETMAALVARAQS